MIRVIPKSFPRVLRADSRFQRHLAGKFTKAFTDFIDTVDVSHPGTKGRIREAVVEHLFKDFLPTGFAVGTGHVVDYRGFESPEIDLVVYKRDWVTPIMWDERLGFFPVEACAALIAVKSKLTAPELADVLGCAKKLREARVPQDADVNRPWLGLLAFDSDLKNKTEKERYDDEVKKLKLANGNRVLHAMCVLKRASIFWRGLSGLGYMDDVVESKGNWEEGIAFLVSMLDELPRIVEGRQGCALTPYSYHEPPAEDP